MAFVDRLRGGAKEIALSLSLALPAGGAVAQRLPAPSVSELPAGALESLQKEGCDFSSQTIDKITCKNKYASLDGMIDYVNGLKANNKPLPIELQVSFPVRAGVEEVHHVKVAGLEELSRQLKQKHVDKAYKIFLSSDAGGKVTLITKAGEKNGIILLDAASLQKPPEMLADGIATIIGMAKKEKEQQGGGAQFNI